MGKSKSVTLFDLFLLLGSIALLYWVNLQRVEAGFFSTAEYATLSVLAEYLWLIFAAYIAAKLGFKAMR